jgi:pimeloyl-ACP methyl ester carboxylesterase
MYQILIATLWLGLCSAIDPPSFDWSSIEPASELTYSPCYDGFKCARLVVPLDWLDPENGEKATIAIVTLPATVPESDPSFGGTIITNPGGPGGSGTAFQLSRGRQIQGIVDGNKHYEIISFDPRGVAHSTPTSRCFGDEFTRATAAFQHRDMGSYDDGPAVIQRQFARSNGVGRLCNTTVHAFMSTASVCRDMVEMVDKIDERLQKTLAAAAPSIERHSVSQAVLASRSEKNNDVPRIQYYGFSYGTVLGNTFASMYPGRVGRMILDGVVDIDDYYTAVRTHRHPPPIFPPEAPSSRPH